MDVSYGIVGDDNREVAHAGIEGGVEDALLADAAGEHESIDDSFVKQIFQLDHLHVGSRWNESRRPYVAGRGGAGRRGLRAEEVGEGVADRLRPPFPVLAVKQNVGVGNLVLPLEATEQRMLERRRQRMSGLPERRLVAQVLAAGRSLLLGGGSLAPVRRRSGRPLYRHVGEALRGSDPGAGGRAARPRRGRNSRRERRTEDAPGK